MDVTPLETAYARVLDAAAEGPPLAPSGDEWPAELVLAHLIAANRSFAATTADVLAGLNPRYDNHASTFRPYLEAVAAAAGGWDELVETFRRSGREVVALASRLDEELSATPVHTHIVSDGTVMVDEALPWAAVLTASATRHIPLHIEQLASLR